MLFNLRTRKQTHYLESFSELNAVTVSSDGQYIAAGTIEPKPDILIWSLRRPGTSSEEAEFKPFKQFKAHRHGLKSLTFSPDSRWLLSIGHEDDKGIFLFDAQSYFAKFSQNKSSRVVLGSQFQKAQEFFVTFGHQHLKVWRFDDDREPYSVQKEGKRILESTGFEIGKCRDKVFVGAACTRDERVFVLARDGLMYEFNADTREMARYIDLQLERGFGLSQAQGKEWLLVAGAQGVVRVMSFEFDHVTTFTKPVALGHYNVPSGSDLFEQSEEQVFADCLCCLGLQDRAISVYSDNTFFVWNIEDFQLMSVVYASICHNSEIKQIKSTKNGQFVSIGNDLTIRYWEYKDEVKPKNCLSEYLQSITHFEPVLKQSLFAQESVKEQTLLPNQPVTLKRKDQFLSQLPKR